MYNIVDNMKRSISIQFNSQNIFYNKYTIPLLITVQISQHQMQKVCTWQGHNMKSFTMYMEQTIQISNIQIHSFFNNRAKNQFSNTQ